MNEGPQPPSITPGEAPLSEEVGQPVAAPTKTPLFQAMNALRYQRQKTIAAIQERSERRLICYVAGREAPIDRDDTVGFVDLLHNVEEDADLDLLLHTGGGDIDAAEKLITMVRTKVGNATLRIVVPDYAKSAGTLMVLGADSVVMSDTSELGPIDPQVILADGKGNRIRHSIQCYLDAYECHSAALRKNPTDVPSQIMLGKLEPATIKLYEAIRDRARMFAENQLKKGMFRNGKGNWSQTVSELLDTKRWQSHAQMISWQDAADSKIGLSVEYLAPKSELWQQYWHLYCLQRLAASDRQKLFESDYVSLLLDV
jgi:Serine dehydrogenase proteinase